MSDISTEELRQNFDHFDTNNDGKIELAEFAKLLEALDAAEPGEDLTMGFSAIDTDSSGVVEFDEFETWFLDR